MTQPTCSIDGCGEKARARGWCMPHYRRWRRHGDPLYVPEATKRRRMTAHERFLSNVDRRPNGCWQWTGTLDQRGYGKLTVDGAPRAAHRLSYSFAKGPIPDGLVIDHLCRNPGCVNPDHLEAVAQRENVLRGASGQPGNPYRTHCPNGHAYAGDNVILVERGTSYRCRECRRLRDQEKRARRAKGASDAVDL